MHLIYEALKKTGGKTDGEALIAAAKGLSWESPRGPVSIDPETRDIIQTIYIRKVEKVGNDCATSQFDKVEKVKDPVKAAMKRSSADCGEIGRRADHRPPAARSKAWGAPNLRFAQSKGFDRARDRG